MSNQFEPCKTTPGLFRSSSLNSIPNLSPHYNTPYMDVKIKSSDGLNANINGDSNDVFNTNHNDFNNNNNHNKMNNNDNNNYDTIGIHTFDNDNNNDNNNINSKNNNNIDNNINIKNNINIYNKNNNNNEINNIIDNNNKDIISHNNNTPTIARTTEQPTNTAQMASHSRRLYIHATMDDLLDMFVTAEQNNIFLKMAMIEERNEKMVLQKQIEDLENLKKQQELNIMRAVHQHQLWSDSLRKEMVTLQEEKDEAVRDYELVMLERKEVHMEMKQLNAALKQKDTQLQEAKERISSLEKLLNSTKKTKHSLDETPCNDNVDKVKKTTVRSRSYELREKDVDRDVVVCVSDSNECYHNYNHYHDGTRVKNCKYNNNNNNNKKNNNNNKLFDQTYYLGNLLEEMKSLRKECDWLRGEMSRKTMVMEENEVLRHQMKKMVEEDKIKEREIGKIQQELDILRTMQALKNQKKMNPQKMKKSTNNNNPINIKDEIKNNNNENYKNKTKTDDNKSQNSKESKMIFMPYLSNSFYSKDSAIDSDNQPYGSPLHPPTLPSAHPFQAPTHIPLQPPPNYSTQQDGMGKADPVANTSSENEQKVVLNTRHKTISSSGTSDMNSDNKDEKKSSDCGYDRDFEDGHNTDEKRDDFNYFEEDDGNFNTMLNVKDFSAKYGTFDNVKKSNNEDIMNLSNTNSTRNDKNIDNPDSTRQQNIKNANIDKEIVRNKTKNTSSNFVRHGTWPKYSQLDWSSSNDEDDRECCYYGNSRFDKAHRCEDEVARGNKVKGVCVEENLRFKRDFSSSHACGNTDLVEKYSNKMDVNNSKNKRRVRSSLRENSKLKRLFLFKNKGTNSTGKDGDDVHSDEVGAEDDDGGVGDEDDDGGVGDEDDYWRRLYKRNVSVRLMKMCKHCRRIVRKKGVLNSKYNNDEDACNVKNKKTKNQWDSSRSDQKHHPCHRIQLSDSIKDFMKPVYKEVDDERKNEGCEENENNEDSGGKENNEECGLKENRNSLDKTILRQVNPQLSILDKSPMNDETTKVPLHDKDNTNHSDGALLDLTPAPLDRGNGARSSLTLMKDFLKNSSQQPVQLQETSTNDLKLDWQHIPADEHTHVSIQQREQSLHENNKTMGGVENQLSIQLPQHQTLFRKNHQKPFFVQPKFRNLSSHLQTNIYPANMPSHQANNNLNDFNNNFLNLFRLEKQRMKKLKIPHKPPFFGNDKRTSAFYYSLSDYDDSIDKSFNYTSNHNNSDVESLASSFTSSSNPFLLSTTPFRMPPSLPSTPLSHFIHPPSLILSSPPSSPPPSLPSSPPPILPSSPPPILPSTPPPILPSSPPPQLSSFFIKNNFSYNSVSLNKLNSNELPKNRPRPGETRNITLQKNIKSMGFSIRSSSLGGIFVSSVGENSPASQAGFEIGDQLLEVCGINMRGASETVATKVLHQVEGTVNLLVQYNPQKYAESIQNKTQNDVTRATNEEREKRVVKIGDEVVSKGLSFNVAGGNVVGVFVDGVGQGAEGLKVKDRILEYNKKSFQGLTLEEAMEELQRPNQNASFVVCHDPIGYEQMLNKPGDCIYLRAMFSHKGVKPQELSFNKGDIILLENTYYQQAEKHEDSNKYNYHNQDKTQLRSDPARNHLWWAHRIENIPVASGFIDPCVFYQSCLEDQNAATSPPTRTTTSPMNDRKASTSKSPQVKTTNSLLSKSSSHSSFRKGLFQRFKSTGSFSKDDPVEEEEEEDVARKYDHKYLGFEQVHKFYSDNYKRPVILVGPFNHHIISKIVSESRDKFTEYIPEFTKSRTCDNKEHSRIEFIDSTGCSQHISVPSLKRLMAKNYHCLLSLPLQLVSCLHAHHIYPIVLFVKFKNYKQIREVRQSMYQPDKTSGKQAKLMLEQASELEGQYKHLFSDVIRGDNNLASVCFKVKGAIDQQQQKSIWVSQQSLEFFKQ